MATIMPCILGKKIEMLQIFDKEGNAIPVTLVEAGPCTVVQIKTKEQDSYDAMQLGFKKLKPKKVKKPQKEKPFRYIREFKDNIENYKMGQNIDVSIFKPGDKVKVSGISKGKGFAGVVKRWNFAGQPASHGGKHHLRGGGSIGSAWPQRVLKGKKMAGRMGTRRITVKNLEVIKVDPENHILVVKGAIPGSRGTLVEIKK